MGKSKIKITNLELVTANGQPILISIEEAKDLYTQLHALFGEKEVVKNYPVYVERPSPYWKGYPHQAQPSELTRNFQDYLKKYTLSTGLSSSGMTVQGSSLKPDADFSAKFHSLTLTTDPLQNKVTTMSFRDSKKEINTAFKEESIPETVSLEKVGVSGLKVKFIGALE